MCRNGGVIVSRRTTTIAYPKLQSLLEQNNLSQKKFAAIIEIPHTTLNNKMTGRRPFTFDEVYKIICHFKKTYEEIFLPKQST